MDLGRSGIYFQHKNGFDAVVNLNDGGTLWTARMNAGVVGGAGVYYNFNGGKVCPTQAWGFTDQWNASGNDPAQATVYDGGVSIDPSRCVVDNDRSRIPFSFKKATGMGVKSIELPASDSDFWNCNFFGPTRIIISGKGHAATALVDFDLWTKKPRGVIVTGAGFDYDENTTAVVESWDGKKTYPCQVTMFTHKGTGGLTVTGGYGVALASANTYGGPTRVEGGSTLIMGAVGAFPAGSPIELRPGASTHSTLDLSSMHNPTVPSVTGAGSVINGAVTVTDEIAFYLADAKAGKFLNFSNLLTLGSGVKVRVMDPENLDDTIKSLTIVSANGGLSAPKTLSLVDLPSDQWGIVIRGNKIYLTRHRGFSILVR